MGTSNASELALQVQNSLELDQASLKQPGLKKKIVIRFLARNAKLSDKKRIFDENTGENAAGSTGELALFTPMVFISEDIANLKHHWVAECENILGYELLFAFCFSKVDMLKHFLTS